MGRQLDWFVVSISLLVLLVNQRLAKDEPGVAAPPEVRAPVVAASADASASPFAYVRPDGSELRVPATGNGPLVAVPATAMSAGDWHGRRIGPFDSRTALYTWSVPADSPRHAALPVRN